MQLTLSSYSPEIRADRDQKVRGGGEDWNGLTAIHRTAQIQEQKVGTTENQATSPHCKESYR